MQKKLSFNSFIYRVVLFDDCVYIFYNTSPNKTTKVKLDKSDLTELREYRINRKSTQFVPLGSNWVLMAEKAGFEPKKRNYNINPRKNGNVMLSRQRARRYA